MKWRLVDIPTHDDGRGRVSVVEAGGAVPFTPRRVYYLHGIESGQSRGFHGHRDLEQLFFAIGGSFRLVLDDGTLREEMVVDQPTRGVYVAAMVWRELYDFSPGATCMVVASHAYDAGDYIRDYDEFVAAARRAG